MGEWSVEEMVGWLEKGGELGVDGVWWKEWEGDERKVRRIVDDGKVEVVSKEKVRRVLWKAKTSGRKIWVRKLPRGMVVSADDVVVE